MSMSDLEQFLALPDVENIIEEVFVSERLGKFKVKAMTADEHREYQKQCQGRMKKGGIDFDTTKFNLLLVAGQTVSPNFANAEFLKKSGCTTAMEFIKKKLKAGEIAELATQICAISGFETDITEDIEQAKN